MPLKRLERKTTKENLWLYILTLLKEKPMYAYEIKKSIKERFGFGIGNVTAYMVLYKLSRKGYVKTEWKIIDNRQRKYYLITPSGRKILNEGINYLKNMLSGLRK